MTWKNIINLSKIAAVLIIIPALQSSCSTKKLSGSSGDAKVYNDDSDINMKTIEVKSKMPFDTISIQKVNKVPAMLQTE